MPWTRLVRPAILVYLVAVALVSSALGVHDVRRWSEDHEAWDAALLLPLVLLVIGAEIASRRRTR